MMDGGAVGIKYDFSKIVFSSKLDSFFEKIPSNPPPPKIFHNSVSLEFRDSATFIFYPCAADNPPPALYDIKNSSRVHINFANLPPIRISSRIINLPRFRRNGQAHFSDSL